MSTTAPCPSKLRWRAALLVTAAVLFLHSALLGLVDKTAGRGWAAQALRTVSVRKVMASEAVQPPPSADAAPTPTAMAAGARTKAPVQPAQKAPATSERPAEGAIAPVDARPPAAEPLATPEPGGLQVPVYSTQLPASTVLRYESRRGVVSGVAELTWQRSDDGYRLRLEGQALGAPFISWTSAGGLDAAGLAPLRHAELRRGREARAVNFQRDNGRVTFSGPPVEHPLVPGMQDRLSWLVQLPAILQANPTLGQPGQQVQMAVVGPRGDAEVWTFSVQDLSTLDLPSGPVSNTVHLLREPRRPYDTQVQVWLDPARQHLPVQAWLRVRATGEGTELRLLDQLPP